MTKLYFAWVDSQETFDPKIHNREDEAVFNLRISHKEGEFPKALVEIKNPRVGLLAKNRKSRAFIAVERDHNPPSLIFEGYVVAMPLVIEGETTTIEFSREGPEDANAFKEALIALKQPPYFDPLFMAEEDQDNPQEILDARSQLPHWFRDHGNIVFSDILEGRYMLDIGDQFIRDSLRISVKNIPFRAISVELTAEWVQSARGFCDITSKIKRHLENGEIHTLTGGRFSKQWQHMVSGLHETGYRMVKSNLNLVGSRPITLQEEPKIEAISHKYEIDLCLNWKYEQKRLETLRFTIYNGVQPLLSCHQNQEAGRHKVLKIRLQDITKDPETPYWKVHQPYKQGDYVRFGDSVYQCTRDHESAKTFYQDYADWEHALRDNSALGDQARSSFFTIPRGGEAVHHAMEMARAYLAASSRCVHISVKVPLEMALDVSCDHMMRLKDSRLPGKEVVGKVVAYDFTWEGATDSRYAKIAMASSIGKNKGDIPDTSLPKTPSGIAYHPFDHQLPQQGITDPKKLTADHLVKHIEITNQTDQQIAHVRGMFVASQEDLVANLKTVPTDLKIELLSLAGEEALHHEITVDIPHAWIPPQQLCLGE